MEKKVCKHFKSFSKCNFKSKEPDGTFSDVYEVGCDLITDRDFRSLSKCFSCFEGEGCELLSSLGFDEVSVENTIGSTPSKGCSPSTEDEPERDYDVISTSSHVKPEDMPRLAEAFASGTYIPGVTENPGATSLDADGKCLLRYYSCRYGDIELLPYVRTLSDNNIVFEIVKWYPNIYFGKHDDYIIKNGTGISKINPGYTISSSLLDLKECNYVISYVHLVKGKSIEPVSNRPSELKGEDLQNYNRLKKLAKYIVGNIIDKEKSAGENNFAAKKEGGL